MEPVVSNEKTISLTSAPPVALAAAAAFGFLAGDGTFSSFFSSSTAVSGFWDNR